MDKWNDHNTMITKSDSKKTCCAPLFESLGFFVRVHVESPSDRVFMNNGIDIDQYRNYSEREFCSSFLSGLLIDQYRRREGSCLPSIALQMRLAQKRNNNNEVYPTEPRFLNVVKRHRGTIHQSRLHSMVLMNITLMKEKIFTVVSLVPRFN